jgi:transcription elongation factor GreA
MENIFLTPEGYEKLKKEIEFLKKVRRRELSEEIGKARAQGDISENAEYDAAKEAQALNEKRIAELEDKLTRAQVIDENNIAREEIRIGATVKLKDLISGKELQYTLLSELESDVSQGIISVTSPVGKALLGHKENEIVEIKIPAGTLKYKVLKISR